MKIAKFEEIENDFDEKQKNKVVTYVNNGCPGLARVVKDEQKIKEMSNMYMAGYF